MWFKHDLRTDDHPGLADAAAAAGTIVPCYCFDERLYGPLLRTPLGFEGARHSNPVPGLCLLPTKLCKRERKGTCSRCIPLLHRALHIATLRVNMQRCACACELRPCLTVYRCSRESRLCCVRFTGQHCIRARTARRPLQGVLRILNLYSCLQDAMGRTWADWHARLGTTNGCNGSRRSNGCAGLVGTVEGLRAGLRSRGSDLIVLRGPLEEQLPELAAAVGAQRIVTEDEVEFRHVAAKPQTQTILVGFQQRPSKADTMDVSWTQSIGHPMCSSRLNARRSRRRHRLFRAVPCHTAADGVLANTCGRIVCTR